jgi:TPR repeat protein
MINFVLCLSLSIAGAGGQGKSAAPEPQPLRQESGPRAPLSPSEISQLKTTAEAGDASAARKLAEAYAKASGVAQNDALAARWYRKAADQGDPEAQRGSVVWDICMKTASARRRTQKKR